MSPNDRSGSALDSRVERLVASVQPEIERLIEASPLSREAVASHVRETLVRLAVRWDSLHDPKDWLLKTLEWGLRGDVEGSPEEEAGGETDRDDRGQDFPPPSDQKDRE